MWGQVPTYAKQVASEKIIPTRVGTSNTQGLLSASKQDHPHACGDKCTTFSERLTLSGSSPRVWGQVMTLQPFTPAIRIIPTRVGTRSKCLTHCMIQEDHPHACGDKRMLKKLTHTTLGSSPRVWGQASTAIFKPKTIRIIPTRVGTSDIGTSKALAFEDHPHACGDKLSLYNIVNFW